MATLCKHMVLPTISTICLAWPLKGYYPKDGIQTKFVITFQPLKICPLDFMLSCLGMTSTNRILRGKTVLNMIRMLTLSENYFISNVAPQIRIRFRNSKLPVVESGYVCRLPSSGMRIHPRIQMLIFPGFNVQGMICLRLPCAVFSDYHTYINI
jgi:hypothetical protein